MRGGERVVGELAIGVAHPVKHLAPRAAMFRSLSSAAPKRSTSCVSAGAVVVPASSRSLSTHSSMRASDWRAPWRPSEGEVERFAVMRRKQQETDFASGKSLGQQVAQREEVAQRIAHLLAFHQQERAVQPVFDETRAIGGCPRLRSGRFRLRDGGTSGLRRRDGDRNSGRAASCSWHCIRDASRDGLRPTGWARTPRHRPARAPSTTRNRRGIPCHIRRWRRARRGASLQNSIRPTGRSSSRAAIFLDAEINRTVGCR